MLRRTFSIYVSEAYNKNVHSSNIHDYKYLETAQIPLRVSELWSRHSYYTTKL